jgi:hypothetical protein
MMLGGGHVLNMLYTNKQIARQQQSMIPVVAIEWNDKNRSREPQSALEDF